MVCNNFVGFCIYIIITENPTKIELFTLKN